MIQLNGKITIKNTSRASLQRESFSARRKDDYCRAVNERHNFLIYRVVPDWNKLTNPVKTAPLINSFKARLDERNNMTTIVQSGGHRLGTCT